MNTAALSIAPGSLRAWVLAARPATLTAAVVPVLVGTACAHAGHAQRFRVGASLAALAGAIFIQIGTNFANDVFDHDRGADTQERLGPTRAAQAGLLTRRELHAGVAVAFGAATVFGLYLAVVAGWPIFALGVLSILSGLAYTGGPYPLGYHGLGDVFVAVFFGFVAVCGTAYVEIGRVPSVAWFAGAGVGAIATAILVVNNLRDLETDAKAGKHTLAVRFGRGFASTEYIALIGVAFVVPLVLTFGLHARIITLVPLVLAPFAVGLALRVLRTRGRALNPLLVLTAQLLLGYGVLLATGIWLGV